MSENSLQEQTPAEVALAQQLDTSQERGIPSQRGDHSPSTRARYELIFLLVLLFNAVTAGLGGLYASTRSVAVVTVAATLVALLGVLCLVVGRKSD